MKQLNLLLCCLMFTVFVSACNKEEQEEREDLTGATHPHYNSIGDFGLKSGECIATKEFIDGVLQTELNYNAENNVVIIKTYSNELISETKHLELNIHGEVVKMTEFDNGVEQRTLEYIYNDEALLSNILITNPSGLLTQETEFTYNDNACRLQQSCIVNSFCKSYTYTDSNCSFNEYTSDFNGESITEYILDDKLRPISALLANAGIKHGNVLSINVADSFIVGYAYRAKYEDFIYNEQGYPLSFSFYEAAIHETDQFTFTSNYAYQYFCFE